MPEAFRRSGDSSPEPPSGLLQTPGLAVVGRDFETQVIERCVDTLVGGRGTLLLVGGEPGIGKSTLAQIAEHRAVASGVTVTWGRSREDRGSPALWPWLQALRMLGLDSEEATRKQMGAAGDDLWSMMSLSQGEEGTVEADAELSASRRFRLFEAIAELLRSRDAPVCVLLDDIHRADEVSLALLRHIGEIIDLQPTFVVATFRDNELYDTHPLRATLSAVASRPSSTVLTLGPLSPGECRRHVKTLVGEGRLDPETVQSIIDRSGGNPFFLEELVRAVSSGEAAAHLPLTIREVILQRAQSLDGPTRSAIETLSVLGREFDLDDAEYLLDSGSDVTGWLPLATRSGLLDRTDHRVRFRHALVRDALYESLPVELRMAHHKRLATRQPSERPLVDELTDLAHHSAAASDLGASVDVVGPALAAARAASTGVGHDEAIKWFKRALDEDLGSDRIPVTVELADAQLRAGEHETARATFQLAFELATGADDVSMMATAALGVGRCVVTAGPVDTALVTMLEEAHDRLPQTEVSFRSRLLGRLGVELYWHDGDSARRLTSEALQLAELCTSPRVRAEAMHARMFCLRGPGRLSERVALGKELVDLAGSEGLVDDEFRGRVWLIPELLQIPDLAAYRTNIAALTTLAERTGHPLHRWYADLYRAQRAITVGSLSDASRLATSALDHGRQAGAQVAEVYHIGQQFLIHRDLGGLEHLVDEMTELSARFEVFPTVRALLALLHVDLGRDEEASAGLTRLAHQRFSIVPLDSLWIATLCICGEVSFRTRISGTGSLIASLLEPHIGTCAVQGLPTCFGAVDRYLGLALAAAGRIDRGRRHLRRAVDLHRQWGFVPLALRSELDLIRVELLPSDISPARAKALNTQATSLSDRAAQHDLHRLAEEASSLVEEVTRRRPPRLAGPGGELTERESEIIALIADGVTNQGLAEQLTISINTVERHVRNIYTKLGVANRAEAVAAHLRHAGV